MNEPLAALRSAYPRARITLGCRAAVAPLIELCAEPPDDVLPFEVDPYAHEEPTPDLISRTRKLLETLPTAKLDLYISAGLRPPWLGWVIAAKLAPARAVIASDARPSWLAREILTALNLVEAHFEYAAVSPGIHERDRYAALLKHAGVSRKDGAEFRIPDTAAQDATRILQAAGFSGGSYLACFPISSRLTPEKRWPLERYTQVLQEVHEKFGLPILLLGDRHEAAEIEQYTVILKSMGMRTASFNGDPCDIPLAAALLSGARAYLGNDTGLAHLATAFDTPGVTVYGGGTWPMYAPWKSGSIGVVHPLACFGCYWDCTFGRGVCVESVPAESVVAALSGLLHGKRHSDRSVVELSIVPPEEQAVIAEATKRYRELQMDRAARLEALEQSRTELTESARKLQETQAAADERLEALRETKDALTSAVHENHRLQELAADADSIRVQSQQRDRLLEELQAALEDRDRHAKELQDAAAQLTAAVEEREARLNELTKRRDQLQALADAAEAREKVIVELSAALEETDRRAKSLQEAADLRGQNIEELSAALDKQNERVSVLEVEAKNFQEMHATAQEREKIIFELNGALNEREKDAHTVLESAREREALIIELSAAVEERERRIAQLERVAEERLVALKETDDGLRAITAEADRRAIMLSEVTSLLHEKTDES